MMKAQIGIGVLSIPEAFDVLGIVPGIVCLLVIAVVTTWSGYMVGVFKLNHRDVYGVDDATGLIFGPIGREILGIGFLLCEPTTGLLVKRDSNCWHSSDFLRCIGYP